MCRVAFKMKHLLRWLAFSALLTASGGLLVPPLIYAHGSVVTFTLTQGVWVHARYDTGQPMSKAQIAVFAPDNPTRPWMTGTADQEGRFAFVPDPTVPGVWAVQARQAGHGAMVHIPIHDAPDLQPVTHSGSEEVGRFRQWVMAAAVVWGFIGTALFFSRKRAP